MGWERAAQFCRLCQRPPGMHDCSHCRAGPCPSAQTSALSHYCRQSSCRSLPTPRPLMLTPPGHFNCNPQLKVFIKFPLRPASSVRSALCRPDRQSSEEHLQFKRDAYATAVSRIKGQQTPLTPRTVSPLQGVWCLSHRIVGNSILPATLFAQMLQGWPSSGASWPELPSLSGCPWVCGAAMGNHQILPSASHHKAQGEDDCNSCSAGLLMTNGPVTLRID